MSMYCYDFDPSHETLDIYERGTGVSMARLYGSDTRRQYEILHFHKGDDDLLLHQAIMYAKMLRLSKGC